MKKPVIGVLLHGCGAQDGSEIHEAVFAMAALEMAGAELLCLAPKGPQFRVTNHKTGADEDSSRDMLVESARIARGRVQDLAEVKTGDLDGLVIPGGFGTAYNLCDFATKGTAMEVRPDVTQLLLGLHEMGKPIGAICIAPVILAKVFGAKRPTLTLGQSGDAAKAAENMGAVHAPAATSDCVVDEALKLVTTPAYMLAERISDVFPGIQKLAIEVVRLARKK